MAYQKARRAHTAALLFLSLKLFFKQGDVNLVTDYLLLIFYYPTIVTFDFSILEIIYHSMIYDDK